MDINSDKKIINNTQSTIPTKLYFTPDANFIDEINELKNTLAPENDLTQNKIENPESQMKTDTLLESVVNEFKIKNDGFKVQKTINQKIRTDNNDKKITENECEKIQNETNSEKSPIIQSNPDLNTEDLKEEQPKAILNKENDDNPIRIQNKKHVEQEIDTEKSDFSEDKIKQDVVNNILVEIEPKKTEIDEQPSTIITEKNEINHIKKEEKEEITVKVVSLSDEQTVSEDESFVVLNDTHEPIIEPEEDLKHIELSNATIASTENPINQESESLKVVDFNKVQEPELKNDIKADMPIIDEEEAITEEIVNHKDIEPKIIDDENLKSDIKIDSFDNDVINTVDNFYEDLAVLPQKEDTLNSKSNIKEEPTFPTKYEVDDTVLNKDTLPDKINDPIIKEEEPKIIKNESILVEEQVAPADNTEIIEGLNKEISSEEPKIIEKDNTEDKNIIENTTSQPINIQVEKIASIIEQNTPKIIVNDAEKNEPDFKEIKNNNEVSEGKIVIDNNYANLSVKPEQEQLASPEIDDLRQEGTINNLIVEQEQEQEQVEDYSILDKEIVHDTLEQTPQAVSAEPQINKFEYYNKIIITEQIKNDDIQDTNKEVKNEVIEHFSQPIEINEVISTTNEDNKVYEISDTVYSIEKPSKTEFEPKAENIDISENQQQAEPIIKNNDNIVYSDKAEKIPTIENTPVVTDKSDNTKDNKQILPKIEEKELKVEPQIILKSEKIIEPESTVIKDVMPPKKEHVELNIPENQIIKPEKTIKNDNENKAVIIENANINLHKIDKNREKTALVEEKNLTNKDIINPSNKVQEDLIHDIQSIQVQPKNAKTESITENKSDKNILSKIEEPIILANEIEPSEYSAKTQNKDNKIILNTEKTVINETKKETENNIISQKDNEKEMFISKTDVHEQSKNAETESITENKSDKNASMSQEKTVIFPPELEITETPIKKEIKKDKIFKIEDDVHELKIKEDSIPVVISDILQKEDKSSNIIKHEPALAEKHAKEEVSVSENNIINTQPIKEEIKPQTQTSMSFNMGQESFESVLGKNNEIKESDKELEEDLAILSTNEENIAMAAANNAVQKTIQVTQVKNAKLANAVDPMSQLIADTNKQMQITRRILQKGETKTNFKPNNEVTYSEVVTEIEEVTPVNDTKPTVVKESHVEQKTVVKEKTVKVKPETMPQKDVNFVLTLTKTDSINLAETLINQTEQGEQTAQNSAISNRLLELIKKAMNENKPLRLDFDNNISVIIKISKEGKISADFIPGDKAVENYLRNNIPLLKQQFENKNIEYDDLTHQNAKQQKDKDNTKNKKEQKNE